MYKNFLQKLYSIFSIQLYWPRYYKNRWNSGFLGFPGDPLLQTLLSVHSAPRAPGLSREMALWKDARGWSQGRTPQLHSLWEPRWPPAEDLRSTSLPWRAPRFHQTQMTLVCYLWTRILLGCCVLRLSGMTAQLCSVCCRTEPPTYAAEASPLPRYLVNQYSRAWGFKEGTNENHWRWLF